MTVSALPVNGMRHITDDSIMVLKTFTMQIYKLFFNSFVPDANLTQRQIPEKEKQDVKENASNHCKMSFEKIPAKS